MSVDDTEGNASVKAATKIESGTVNVDKVDLDEIENDQVQDEVNDSAAIKLEVEVESDQDVNKAADTLTDSDEEEDSILNRLQKDLKKKEMEIQDGGGQTDEELSMIRKLLDAEASQDAREILGAQDDILSSPLANEIEIGEQANSSAVRRMRKKMENNSFLTPTMSSVIESNTVQAQKEKAVENGQANVESEIAINDVDGLNDEEIDAFVGTYEENQCLSNMISRLDIKDFESLFAEDPSFMDDFRWWCRVCLRARRFRTERAVQLIKGYAKWRLESRIFKSEKDKVKRQLESGFLIFLEDARCVDGRGIIVIRLTLHDPKKYVPQDVVVALHSVLLYALKSDPFIQAKGFTVLMDMTNARYRNFDLNIAKAVSKALNSTMPMRYGKLILYNPPFFFSTLYKLIYIFLTKKMRDRMVRLFPATTKPQEEPLFKYIEKLNLPSFFGGDQQLSTLNFAEDVVVNLDT